MAGGQWNFERRGRLVDLLDLPKHGSTKQSVAFDALDQVDDGRLVGQPIAVREIDRDPNGCHVACPKLLRTELDSPRLGPAGSGRRGTPRRRESFDGDGLDTARAQVYAADRVIVGVRDVQSFTGCAQAA